MLNVGQDLQRLVAETGEFAESICASPIRELTVSEMALVSGGDTISGNGP